MARKWYGSVNNRLDENRMFCDKIEVGTGMTEYMWSDCHAFEVVEVDDQKHIKVRRLDHIIDGDVYENKWKLVSNENNPIHVMTKRGNYWYWTTIITADILNENTIESKLVLAHNNIDANVLRRKGKVVRYRRANVSFGVARYYYDYEF